MSGTWVFVCGPSGAGKDSVIGWAQDRLAGDGRIVFTRRLVTRAAGPQSEHDEISPAGLWRMKDQGKLAWHWEANGHGYGIASHYEVDIEAGRIVVVNGSREHAAALPAGAARRVLVTASGAALRERLQTRGREDAAAVAQRLARNDTVPPFPADLLVHNEGRLEDAAGALVDYLLCVASEPRP